jgi:hypothetical protein
MLSCPKESDGGYFVRDRWAIRSARAVGLAAVVAMAVAGCSHNLEVDATLDKPPAVEPLPVAMGVYYPPELRIYHRSIAFLGIHTFDTDLGPPSIALFDQIFSSMFARIVPVAEHPSSLDDDVSVAAIIVMRIERFQPYSFSFGAHSTIIRTPAEITYRATLYLPHGQQFATWTVEGSGVFEEEFDEDVFLIEPVVQELTAVAMREATAKFVAGFRQQPEVARWLAGLNLAAAPSAP